MRTFWVNLMFPFVAACSSPSIPSKAERHESLKASYLDVDRCWTTSQAGFVGAVAAYDGPSGLEMVLYSGRCSSETYDEALAAKNVRVLCVRGIGQLKRCIPLLSATFDEQIFDPGVRPEFPHFVYAVQGKLMGGVTTNNHLIFTSLDVKKYQAVPKEMFGVIQDNGRERPTYIRGYLSARWLDSGGYRILR